ncbi:MAG: hypothetical protein MZU91_01470 [Desulfosudis oleivorans]|nr:hypothetical protein [Desulfosudis oleivorans]
MGGEVPRSTDNMSPDSRFIKTFASIPIAPGVIAHSIIAVANPEDPKAEWDDGCALQERPHRRGGLRVSPSTPATPRRNRRWASRRCAASSLRISQDRGGKRREPSSADYHRGDTTMKTAHELEILSSLPRSFAHWR